jgi:acyl-coenzyme A synthetase/AMP-(fatty) acid ligase
MVPDLLPPVRGGSSGLIDTSVLVDRLGVVWAERWERTPRGDAQWDIIAKTGLQARVTVPADLRLLAAEGKTAWGVYTDDLGVPTIVRFRVLE